MIPKKFDYYAPSSVNEATKLLHEDEQAKVLAGGQSLLALMKLRLVSPTRVVDISKLDSVLAYIRKEAGWVSIGALTTHDDLEHDPMIKKEFSLLRDATSKIGDQQIRNRGTIGGSCCHADPAADLPTALIALDPKFVVQGPNGERTIPSSEFFVDTFTVSIAYDEILTEIKLPRLPANIGSAYMKHSRREGDFAIVGVGAAVTLGPNKVCEDARISLGAVAATPIRAKRAEEYLRGKTLDGRDIEEAADRAVEGADPPSDMHGSREYRLEMIKVFTRRTLKLALGRTR